MITIKKLCKLFILSFVLAMSSALFATDNTNNVMKLDNSLSALSFVSIKKGTVGEVHTIQNLSGSLSETGDINISLDLASVDTKIAIRDDRMKKYLFEVDSHPTATITAKVGDKVSFSGTALTEGEITINLHGVAKTVPVSVAVVNTGSQVVISSTKPVLIAAADYNLGEGVAMLQKLAKLPSVATAVPVTFVLTFAK